MSTGKKPLTINDDARSFHSISVQCFELKFSL
jgi:hypothetical protein